MHLLWSANIEMSYRESPFSAICSGGLRIMNGGVFLDELLMIADLPREFMMNGACKGAM